MCQLFLVQHLIPLFETLLFKLLFYFKIFMEIFYEQDTSSSPTCKVKTIFKDKGL